VGDSVFQCVCPVEDTEGIKEACNPKIESCFGYVQVVEVGIGFDYRTNANLMWGIMAMVIMGYSSWAGSDFSTADNMRTGWTYNFFWMMMTWGISLLLWTERLLFKSDGGFFHKMFNFWTNLILMNMYLAYWLIDGLILSGTLEYTAVGDENKNDWYFKLFGLFGLQVVAFTVTFLSKPTINFDWNLTQAIPQPYTESEYVAAVEEAIVEEEVVDKVPEIVENRQVTASEIEAYWGF